MKKQLHVFVVTLLICTVHIYPDNDCAANRALFNDDYTEYKKKFKTTARIPITKEDVGIYTPKYYQGYPYHGYYSFGSYTGRSLYF